jgi:hypothetical protein
VIRFRACGAVPLLLALASCGSSSNNGAGAGGAGGQSALDCIDVVLTPSRLQLPGEWSSTWRAIPGALSGCENWLQYAWIGYPLASQGAPWPIVTAVSDDGHTRDLAYKLMPASATFTTSLISSFAARSDGTFAIGYEFVEGTERLQRVALGRHP